MNVCSVVYCISTAINIHEYFNSASSYEDRSYPSVVVDGPNTFGSTSNTSSSTIVMSTTRTKMRLFREKMWHNDQGECNTKEIVRH